MRTNIFIDFTDFARLRHRTRDIVQSKLRRLQARASIGSALVCYKLYTTIIHLLPVLPTLFRLRNFYGAVRAISLDEVCSTLSVIGRALACFFNSYE